MEIIRLTREHHADFLSINQAVLSTLENTAWFIPFSEESLADAFTDKSRLTVYGAIDQGRLVGVSTLDEDEGEWSELTDSLGVSGRCAEIGGSMVLPEVRGQGLMHRLNTALIEVARQKGIEILLATAHPDNLASNKSLKSIGMEQKATIVRSGKYPRNVYMMRI